LTKQQIQGHRAEEIVFQLLQTKGWVLLDRNWSCRWGELDLVLQKDQRLLVVEVKGRTARRHDRGGLDAFHSRKRRRLRGRSIVGDPTIQALITSSFRWC
jgi:putative endonuclease